MGKLWTLTEDVVLRRLYGSASWPRLFAALPNRNKNSIKARARTLSLIRDSYAVGRYFLYTLCSKHGNIHRTEIVWKVTEKGKKYPTCPRLHCGRRLRTVPKNSKQKRRYIDLGLMEKLKSGTKQEF